MLFRSDEHMGSMTPISSDPDNPLLAFYRNYTRFAVVTHAFRPKQKEFWICLDSQNGVLGYFKYQAPKVMDNAESIDFLGYSQLIEVHPASFSIPDSADVYRLFLCPQQEMEN